MTTFWAPYPRDVVRVAGPDALTFLQSQLSQDLRPLGAGDASWAFLLEPAGKVVVLARVWRPAEDVFVLDTDAGFGDVMLARLNRFKIRVDAAIEPLQWTCVAVRGGGVAHAGVPSWGDGVDLLGDDVDGPADVAAGTPIDLESARIEAGWPAMGHEIVPGQTIPAETGIVEVAVSFTKGCYPGQELVERMDSRGASAPRSLRTITVAEGTGVGDPVLADGVEVGRVTSVVGTRALALVRRGA